MTPARVYPARIAARERKLLAAALARLVELGGQDDLTRAISHRLACADRYDEMQERRLGGSEREIVCAALRTTVAKCVKRMDAESARANARALVRLTR